MDKNKEVDDLLGRVMPQDLMKYGIIPEFIGRVPVYAVLDPLDEQALKMILTEPKSAWLKSKNFFQTTQE